MSERDILAMDDAVLAAMESESDPGVLFYHRSVRAMLMEAYDDALNTDDEGKNSDPGEQA